MKNDFFVIIHFMQPKNNLNYKIKNISLNFKKIGLFTNDNS